MAYQSVNPYDGKVLKTFADDSDEQVERALQNAEQGFDTWRNMTFSQRANVLRNAVGILAARNDEFARTATLEMGKLIKESRAEVALSADIIDYFAENAQRFLAPENLAPASGEAVVKSPPLGVLFGIQPWNFPYYQLARFVAPSLMAGNVVLVKHASSVPQCATAFADLFVEAGAPVGAYTNLRVTKEQIARIIADPRVKGVALTGGEDAGTVVAAQVGKELKKSTMELGGSDPFIVLEDADLDQAVKWALWGRIHNAGQSCVASKRFIVVEQLADRFLDRFKAALSELKMGDPMEPGTTLAPLSSREAVDKLKKQVERAVAAGARVEMLGKPAEGSGAFMQPTILTNISRDNPAYNAEFFGPVALFFRVADEDAAVQLANDTKYGLGGSVFTQDIERGKRVADRIESGMVFINHPTWTAPALPFGGVKRSGYGRELSHIGIQEFVNKKLIRVMNPDAPP
jgi:succinate-semialdehyde dehydrogenase / glutarate-semialdehyde dehydrogenase